MSLSTGVWAFTPASADTLIRDFLKESEIYRTTPKQFGEDIKRQAVDLYETTEGASFNSIAAELGIGRSTLSIWLRKYRSSLAKSSRPSDDTHTECSSCTEIKALRAEKGKLETERDILRQAAKYFAGEMTW